MWTLMKVAMLGVIGLAVLAVVAVMGLVGVVIAGVVLGLAVAALKLAFFVALPVVIAGYVVARVMGWTGRREYDRAWV